MHFLAPINLCPSTSSGLAFVVKYEWGIRVGLGFREWMKVQQTAIQSVYISVYCCFLAIYMANCVCTSFYFVSLWEGENEKTHLNKQANTQRYSHYQHNDICTHCNLYELLLRGTNTHQTVCVEYLWTISFQPNLLKWSEQYSKYH